VSLSDRLKARQTVLFVKAEALVRPLLTPDELLTCWSIGSVVRVWRLVVELIGAALAGGVLRAIITGDSDPELIHYLLSFAFGFLPALAILDEWLGSQIYVSVALTDEHLLLVFSRLNWRGRLIMKETQRYPRAALPTAFGMVQTGKRPQVNVEYHGKPLPVSLLTWGPWADGTAKLTAALAPRAPVSAS
jgi:hypothetical protein